METKPKIDSTWYEKLSSFFDSDEFRKMKVKLLEEKQKGPVFPPGRLIFRAFDLCPFDQVKVVILGQDPYHGPGQAHGLCFSVPDGIVQPPSLRNIFRELVDDVGISMPKGGDLSPWAKQGVLLLNSVLTVRAHQAASHHDIGWIPLTDTAISTLSQHKEGVVFLLWGRYAKNKMPLIDMTKHHVLSAAHPSPLSAHNGFFGCRHFSNTNRLLELQGQQPINWQIK